MALWIGLALAGALAAAGLVWLALRRRKRGGAARARGGFEPHPLLLGGAAAAIAALTLAGAGALLVDWDARSKAPAAPADSFGSADMAAYQRACAEGEAEACLTLGYAYESGVAEGAADLRRSDAMYQRSCDLGEARACFNLANNLISGVFPWGDSADGAARGARLLRAACDGDLPRACHSFGMMARRAPDGAADGAWALDRACALGLADSCYEAGLIYAAGAPALPRDRPRARRYFQSACEAGVADACAAL